jgi:murein DD-endopeptidase MepM/ murein hydrolase activator NlpD
MSGFLGLSFLAIPMLMAMVLMGGAVELAACGPEDGPTPSDTESPSASPTPEETAAATPSPPPSSFCGGPIPDGAVAYPLPADAAYVDLRNYGNTGSHWESTHTGTDLSTACGTLVLAATAGTVEIRTDQPWAGEWLIEVRASPGGLMTSYAHMQGLIATSGEIVAAGQVIGVVGERGNATGCHLHFEVHPYGDTRTVDPSAWLAANLKYHSPSAL